MKALIFFFVVVGSLLVGCASNSTLYYHDNTYIEAEIDSIEGCEGLADAIRNNFFYNTEDSVYFENKGFHIHAQEEYHSCLRKLTIKQIRALFGVPHFEETRNKTTGLFYLNRCVNFTGKGFFWIKAEIFSFKNGKLINWGEMPVHESLLPNKKDFSIKDSYFKKANFLYSQVDSLNIKEFGWDCEKAKRKFGRSVYYHKKRKYFLFKIGAQTPLGDYIGEQQGPFCIDTFTKSDVYGLLGKPALVSGDTLYYPLYNKPFIAKSERLAHRNGKILCYLYIKTEEGNYRLSSEFVKPELVFRDWGVSRN